MNVYEVEFRAVITLAAQDMQKAALHGTRVIRDSPHLIYVKAVYEKNFNLNQLGNSGKIPMPKRKNWPHIGSKQAGHAAPSSCQLSKPVGETKSQSVLSICLARGSKG